MRPLYLVLALISVSACAGRYRTASPHEDRLQRQLDIALRTRAQLMYYFVQAGAVERPPMPDALAETQGPEPYVGALWTPGRWVWTNAQWTWESGAWGQADVFTVGDVAFGGDLDDDGYWSDGDDISNPPPLGCACPPGGVRDHRSPPRDWGSRLRDHRTHDVKTKLPAWASSSHPDAIVRDHRSGSGGGSSSTSYESKSKDKDKGSDKDFGSGGHFHR